MRTMRGPSVFISHSAHEDEARGALEAIVDALTPVSDRSPDAQHDGAQLDRDNFDVLLDRERLKGSYLWRPTIRKWMDTCAAAIVLFSPDAINSPNVQNEVAILMQRKRRAPRFPVFGVMVAGAKRASLREGFWNATEMTEVQLFTWEQARTPERIRAELTELIELRPPEHPERRLEVALAQGLGRLRFDSIQLAAADLDMDIAEWQIEADPPKALVQALLESEHEHQVRAVLTLGEVAHDHELAGFLYDKVEPHGLLTPEVARLIRQVAASPGGARGLAVNSLRSDTCQLFVHRANHTWDVYEPKTDWSDAIVDDVMADVCDQVAAEQRYLPHELPIPSAELNDELVDSPMFLLLPSGPSAEEIAPIVTALREQLPNLVLVLRCRDELQLTRSGFAGFKYVEPALEEGEEERLSDLRQTANRKLRKLRPRPTGANPG